MTLLSLFATVVSPSRGLLRDAVCLQLWNGRYATSMRQLCLVHACCYLATSAMDYFLHFLPLSGSVEVLRTDFAQYSV